MDTFVDISHSNWPDLFTHRYYVRAQYHESQHERTLSRNGGDPQSIVLRGRFFIKRICEIAHIGSKCICHYRVTTGSIHANVAARALAPYVISVSKHLSDSSWGTVRTGHHSDSCIHQNKRIPKWIQWLERGLTKMRNGLVPFWISPLIPCI